MYPLVVSTILATVGRLYDVMRVWRQHAVNVAGKALPAGHFIPEEVPDETLAAVLPFLQAGRVI